MSDIKNVFNFDLKEVKIKGIPLLPQAIGETNIYESLVSPGIIGDITIADWGGMDEIGRVIALDDIEFTFNTIDREELKLKYKIFAATPSIAPTSTYHPLTYRFVSPWLIDAYTRPISKAYKDKFIHEIISDLLTECGAEIGYIEPTKQKLHRFTTPLWTCLKSVHYLLSFAMNKEDRAGYIMWTDMKTGKVNVATMDYLFSGKYGKEENKFMALPKNEFYESRIINLTMENSFDVIKYVNSGIGRTIHQGFYYDKNKIVKFDKAVNEVPYTRLSSMLPINNIFTDKKYASIKANYLYPSSDTLISDDNELKDMIDGKAKTKYSRLTSDIFKVNILTNPNSSRRVGHLSDIEWQSADKTISTDNKLYSGTYLIRNIRHMIFGGIYRPIVTLIGDVFKEHSRELISWKE